MSSALDRARARNAKRRNKAPINHDIPEFVWHLIDFVKITFAVFFALVMFWYFALNQIERSAENFGKELEKQSWTRPK